VTENARVLIDAGFSARKLEALLAGVGESLDRIDAVFLTHEHGDHAAGIEGLKKFPSIRVFANAATARAVQDKLDHKTDWQLFETGARFRFRDLEVESFAVPHDAQEPVGFRFTSGRDDDLFAPRRSLVWLTDLGHAPQNIRECIRECEVVVVESNHCSDLLKADTRRPWSLKQRISGRHGHLSNHAAQELLAGVIGAADLPHAPLARLQFARGCRAGVRAGARAVRAGGVRVFRRRAGREHGVLRVGVAQCPPLRLVRLRIVHISVPPMSPNGTMK
jgi:phosphoribosyl 1,2-cyclic phosphodiesterase